MYLLYLEAFKSIYLLELPFVSRYSTRHVDISPTEKRTCFKFSLRPFPVLSVRWRLGEMGPEKVILQGYTNYSNSSDHFPREIIITARRIQQIVTCYDIFSSRKHYKVGQVFASAVSVAFRQIALAFVPAAVSHARPPYHTPV